MGIAISRYLALLRTGVVPPFFLSTPHEVFTLIKSKHDSQPKLAAAILNQTKQLKQLGRHLAAIHKTMRDNINVPRLGATTEISAIFTQPTHPAQSYLPYYETRGQNIDIVLINLISKL